MSAVTNWASEASTRNHAASFETGAATLRIVSSDDCELRSRELPRIVGNSPALENVLEMVRVVAPTDATVLINGETGTGKELIAEAIHKRSDRSKGPFVKVDCAAMPAGLLENELFGHERGAYTGADSRSIGRFERAHGGTLFLDEIGELPLELQPKLLRVIQERQFERLGGTATLWTDVRLVCATHRNLAEMVSEHRFRADLFYRLSVFPIELPPLRERPEDIPLLIQHFAMECAERMRKPICAISGEFMAALERHPWPGNIRELQNFIERSVILSTGTVLNGLAPEHTHTTEDGTTALRAYMSAAPEPASRQTPTGFGSWSGDATPRGVRTLAEADRDHISEVLVMTDGLIAGKGGAAEVLGMPPSTLRNRMRKLGIRARASSMHVRRFSALAGAV